MKQDSFERRHNNRLAIEVELRIVLFNAGLSGVLTWQQLMNLRKGLLVDISSTGIKMKTSDLDSAWFYHLTSGGIQVAMKFKLPKLDQELGAMAQVIWVSDNPAVKKDNYKYLVGLKFTQISSQDQEKIADFIARI